jgi:thiol:disulfide interchange protein DsbC
LIKKSLLFAVAILAGALLFTPIHSVYCFASEGDAQKERNAQNEKNACLAISDGELKGIFTKLNVPGAKILNIAESPVRGLCEIVIDNMGRMGIFYLDSDKKYLIFGSLVELAGMSDKTRESIRKIQDKKRIDITKIPVDEALILGESGASRKVIVFTDPNCPFCIQLHGTMKKIVAKRKDVAFYIKFLPLNEDSQWKAQSIVCNKSLKMLEDNFAKKEIPRPGCTTEEINNSMKLAASFGISGTPALILPDGRIREGAMPEADLIDLIDGKQ